MGTSPTAALGKPLAFGYIVNEERLQEDFSIRSDDTGFRARVRVGKERKLGGLWTWTDDKPPSLDPSRFPSRL